MESRSAPRKTLYLGLLLGFAASITWGTVSLSARYLVHTRGIDPFTVVFFRLAGAAPLLIIAAPLMSRGGEKIKASDWLKIIVLGSIGTFFMANFGFYATKFTTNVNTTLIVSANAIVIAVLAHFYGARVSRAGWLGIFVGFAGLLVIALARGPDQIGVSAAPHAAGIILATLSCLSWASYTVFSGGIVERYGGFRVTLWAMVVGALMQTALMLAIGEWRPIVHFSAGDWAVLVYMAAIPTAFAFTAWFIALKYVDVATLGMTQYINPIVGLVLGWLLLGEHVLPAHYVGGALIFVGLYLATISNGTSKKF